MGINVKVGKWFDTYIVPFCIISCYIAKCISLFCLLCGQNDDFNSVYTCSFAHTLCKFPLILLHLFYTKRDNSFVKMYYSLFSEIILLQCYFLNRNAIYEIYMYVFIMCSMIYLLFSCLFVCFAEEATKLPKLPLLYWSFNWLQVSLKYVKEKWIFRSVVPLFYLVSFVRQKKKMLCCPHPTRIWKLGRSVDFFFFFFFFFLRTVRELSFPIFF